MKTEKTEKKVLPADAAKPARTKEKAAKGAWEDTWKAVMYLGPDIKGMARHGQVFIDGASPALAETAEKIPVLKGLLVPVDQAPEKFAELKAGGTARRMYEKAVALLEKKGEDDGKI